MIGERCGCDSRRAHLRLPQEALGFFKQLRNGRRFLHGWLCVCSAAEKAHQQGIEVRAVKAHGLPFQRLAGESHRFIQANGVRIVGANLKLNSRDALAPGLGDTGSQQTPTDALVSVLSASTPMPSEPQCATACAQWVRMSAQPTTR